MSDVAGLISYLQAEHDAYRAERDNLQYKDGWSQADYQNSDHCLHMETQLFQWIMWVKMNAKQGSLTKY